LKKGIGAPLTPERFLIEDFFAKSKQFRPIATRYDKTARGYNFLAAVHVAASAFWA
jgi:transposase